MRFCWFPLCILALGCADKQVELAVELRTDLIPGVEFTAAEVDLTEDDILQEFPVSKLEDFSGSPRLTNITNLKASTRRLITVRLRDISGKLVASNSVLVDNRSDRVAQITITRSCVDVVCPATSGNPTDIACLGGRCVDPTCETGAEELCPEPECLSDAGCMSTQSCLQPRCETGVCIFYQGAVCAPEEYCSPTLGCQTITPNPCDPGCADQNPCTVDRCQSDGCVNEPLRDGTPCAAGICESGICQDGCEAINCADENPCTVNTCSRGNCMASPTTDGMACPEGSCQDGMCVASAETCVDLVQNQDETDVDCGGSTCPACQNGQRCTDPTDCEETCNGMICVTHCSNDTLDGNESDVDCGGRCAPCGAGARCNTPSDCRTMVCTNTGTSDECQPVTCHDGVQNGDETGLDCGGSLCAPCGFDCASTTGAPATECEALVDLYNHTKGGMWTNSTNWFTTDICSWFGISCGLQVVGKLDLFSNNLEGELPNSIGNLRNLSALNIYLNKLRGTIPDEVTTLPLSELGAQGNEFSGTLPEKLGDMTELGYLALGDNQFSGAIPRNFGRLSTLQELYLAGNQLEGPIPPEIGGLTSCRVFTLNNNRLSGRVPNTIVNIPGTLLFDLSGQTGCLTAEPATATWLDMNASGWNDGC